jgi:hypothetical protein
MLGAARGSSENYRMKCVSDEKIFREVWDDCWKNLTLFGALLLGVVGLGWIAPWLGMILFTMFALLTLRNIFRLLFALGLAVLVLPLLALQLVPFKERFEPIGEISLLNANAVIVMQLFVLLAYNLFLYNYFFIRSSGLLP